MIHYDERHEPRIYDKVGMEISVVMGGEFSRRNDLVHAETIEISGNGLRFRVQHDLGLADSVLLEINLIPPGISQPITQLGRVRWVTRAPDHPGFEVGVQFVFGGRTDHAVWSDYVSRRQHKHAA